MLLALLIFAYASGQRSSRRIEQLCSDHVAFRVLCAQDAPDHTSIARFRAAHHDAFTDLFAQVLALCSAAGMVKVGVVAIDGSKIAANASRGANRSPESVQREVERISAQIAKNVVSEAAAIDAAEDAEDDRPGEGSDGLPEQFARHSGRAANIAKAVAELHRRRDADAHADAADLQDAQEYLKRVEAGGPVGRPPGNVDPVRYHQARIQRAHNLIESVEGIKGAAAAKTRRDARCKLKSAQKALDKVRADIAAGYQPDLRGRAAQRRHLRARRAHARGTWADPVNITDPDSRLMLEGSGGGSVQAYNAQFAVTDDHYVLGVHTSQDANDTHCYLPAITEATTQASALGKQIDLVLMDSGYFTDENLTAAGPERLIAPGKNRDLHTEARDNPTDGPPPPELDPKDAMRHRLRNPANAQRYKRRGATVEPVFAHLKDQIKLRRFSRRGLPAVTAELHLAATVINLLRLHNAQPAT
ncbi:transposase [Mycobacterium sp. TNTM28]|uniref:Transposase n=2 Tax=[Mycobacterium] fortunisiensis TaxID=2600579 RepID=A0ABS6KJ43_9MYCO|nr:transposase [[Mycobacterium] fortunisiensis]